MRLSTRTRYGLRAMVDIALNQHTGPIPLSTIARRQDLSEGYLEQLMFFLKRARLVKSVRGPQGGYLLARPPSEITVGEIVRVFEGPIAPVPCVSEHLPEGCERAEVCVTRLVWSKLRKQIAEVLDSITLEDLVNEARRLGSSELPCLQENGEYGI